MPFRRFAFSLVVIPACAISLFASATRASSGSNAIRLDSSAVIFLEPNSPAPLRKAAEDLRSDFAKVFGKKPSIINQTKDAGEVTIVVAVASAIPELVRSETTSGPESFSISAAKLNWNNRTSQAIVLAGADMRGTIYAVYEFAQKFLRIDPLYFWTDHDPARRASITIPASLGDKYAAPAFKYRGFFINDEDLLTGWAPGEQKDKTGISLAVWDKIFETILRLKGNMVAPGTWIFPDDPQVKAAAARGLIVTQHHAIPLGLNVARWPKDVPYNYTEHPEILERAWKNAVNSYLPDQEVLWSVGLRGLSDVTYASMDPSVRENNQALGALISKAIAAQMRIVRESRQNAEFVTNLWQEGARLVQSGDLKIPPEVGTVWADDGYGYIQDKDQVSAGQGIYDHVAMMNGRANQLTEMVPIERSFSELARYFKAGATHYYLVNTSDIRPVTMSIRAVMDTVWKGLPNDSASASDNFYKAWAEEEFGKPAASHVAELYKTYFKAPAHLGDPAHEYGDQLYHTEVRRMLLTYMIDSPVYAIPSQSPKWQVPRLAGAGFGIGPNAPSGKEWLKQAVAREIQQCGNAQPSWDGVWKQALAIESLVASDRRDFYRSEVLAMIAINRESNRVLLLIAKALQDADAGRKQQAQQQVQQALDALGEIQRTEAAAEYGKWKNWYRGDWLTGIYRTRQMVQTFANFLADPETHISPPILWDGWEAYYHIMHYEGDRSADVK